MVVGDGRHAAEQALGDADRGGRGGKPGVDADARVLGRHRRQPRRHRHAAGGGDGAEGALQQVVVRVDEAGGDHAAGDVELDLVAARLGLHAPVAHDELARPLGAPVGCSLGRWDMSGCASTRLRLAQRPGVPCRWVMGAVRGWVARVRFDSLRSLSDRGAPVPERRAQRGVEGLPDEGSFGGS